jgi:hypothetical protein
VIRVTPFASRVTYVDSASDPIGASREPVDIPIMVVEVKVLVDRAQLGVVVAVRMRALRIRGRGVVVVVHAGVEGDAGLVLVVEAERVSHLLTDDVLRGRSGYDRERSDRGTARRNRLLIDHL